MLCVVAEKGDGEMHLWGMQEAMMKWYVFPSMIQESIEEKEINVSIQRQKLEQQKVFSDIYLWFWRSKESDGGQSINEVWFWHVLKVVTVVTTYNNFN